MTAHNDAANWSEASYSDDPIDHIEPAEPVVTESRRCALAMLDILRGIDQFMCRGGPPRKWVEVSLALGLSSTRGQTESEFADQWGISRAAVSRQVVMILKLTNMEHAPAFGLKSEHDRETFRKTNGRRRALGDRLGDIDSSPPGVRSLST